ncbi:hypothetical protein AAIA72_06495 [Hahella sp. SMD15-11]|uniref:CHRD domain-containing protein n=1 Tax=Thermohahella caldifontis TaxID=3142973 RepID=A0AB39UZ43_9GAMM
MNAVIQTLLALLALTTLAHPANAGLPKANFVLPVAQPQPGAAASQATPKLKSPSNTFTSIPHFLQTGKTPVARIRMKLVSGNLKEGKLLKWEPVSTEGNLQLQGTLGMSCPATMHLTYLAYNIQAPVDSPPVVLHEESQKNKAGISGLTKTISLKPFSTAKLAESCEQLLQNAPPGQWAQPKGATLKATVRATGRCSGGAHPDHAPSRLVHRDYPVLLKLQCIAVVRHGKGG